MPLAPGERVDRYEVLDLLGSGGMGEVYRAFDPRLQRQVALKILREDRDGGTDGPARLLREARAVAALAHPNVLTIFDVGNVQEPPHLRGLTYLAMELVPGKSLRHYVGDTTVPLPRRITWVTDVARGLAAAHRAGLVHRDVKPENVIVRDDGAVKVLDFGIARRAFGPVDPTSSTEGQTLPTITAQGVVIGTPFYMAPEQMRGDTLDGRADQFSWGVLAYELLCGTPPWRMTGDSLTVVSAVLSHHPPPPIELDPDIPASVSDAIMRALSKDAASRFETTDDLLEALGAAQTRTSMSPARPVALRASASAPSPALPVDSPLISAGSAPTPTRARRSIRMVVVGAMLVILAGVAASILLGRRKDEKATHPIVATASADACGSNAECAAVHPGEAWRCHSTRHTCVAVASPDCKVLAEPQDLTHPSTLWIGSLYPLGDEGLAYEPRALDLAREEFSQTISPLGASSGSGHTRPIAVVLCDERTDPTRAARHLVDDVEVPAVVGFRRTSPALEVIGNELLPHGVLSIIAINQADSLTKIPEPAGQPRLVWRTTVNQAGAAAPLAELVSSALEPRARGHGAKTIRVALIRTGTGLQEYVDALFRQLSFNGRSALENGDEFRQFVFGESSDAGDDALVASLVSFAPQVILYQGQTFASKIAEPLERSWRTGARPVYVGSSSIPEDMIAFAGRDAGRRHRIFGVTNVSTTMTNAQFVLRYNLRWPHETVTRTGAPQPSYDAFYLLAYATYAIGDGPVTGAALSRAFDRLRGPDNPVDVGPGAIFRAFDALHAGGRIALRGALGSLDLDPATGEAPVDWAILCPGVDDRGAASDGVESGLVYEAKRKKLGGVMKCP